MDLEHGSGFDWREAVVAHDVVVGGVAGDAVAVFPFDGCGCVVHDAFSFVVLLLVVGQSGRFGSVIFGFVRVNTSAS